MIENIEISNFKSIKNLSLSCKKINLFIGKPNVGKSNILECLSLFGNITAKDVRYESVRNFFYDQDVQNPVKIRVDDYYHFLRFEKQTHHYYSHFFNHTKLPSYLNENFLSAVKDDFFSDDLFNSFNDIKAKNRVNINFKILKNNPNFDHGKNSDSPCIKKYSFRAINSESNNSQNGNGNENTLSSPHGENLFSILKNNRKLLNEVSKLFEEYGYSFIVDFVKEEAEIQKQVENIGYKIPYSLVADTLQRIVFYLLAIRTNSNCTILLEEPENHSFPPYIRDIAFEIIGSDNQFFIATHSPYLFNTLISECESNDLNINVVYYEDYKTKIRTLNEDQIAEISNFGIDAFFNLESFINE